MAALSKAMTPLKRVLPLRMNLMKGLMRGRLAGGGGMTPATASAFVDGPGALQTGSCRSSIMVLAKMMLVNDLQSASGGRRPLMLCMLTLLPAPQHRKFNALDIEAVSSVVPS
jgi:hypothetical protein